MIHEQERERVSWSQGIDSTTGPRMRWARWQLLVAPPRISVYACVVWSGALRKVA